MDFDDIAFRVVEEDLIPPCHGPGPIIRIRNLAFLKASLEGLDVVGAEAEMAAIERVDDVFRAEAEIDVAARKVEFDSAVAE